MNITIKAATSALQFEQFAGVIAEYFVWLRQRYLDQQWLIDQVATAQSLDRELSGLADNYSLPQGGAFLAEADGAIAGAGAWRRRADGSCEMKRVFVREGCQGQGVGRSLCEAIMESARAQGYAVMRLDTAPRMSEARQLYSKLGFVPCAPYHDYPAEINAVLLFMQARLRQSGGL